MNVMSPQVADRFYPGNAGELRRMVEGYLDASAVEQRSDSVCALVTPHAGYIYSGATAGHAYARVRGSAPNRIVLLGVSHSCRFEGLSLCDADAYATPLGRLPIDRAFMKTLIASFKCVDEGPHNYEHTLETQLPFIQVAMGDIPIVPLLLGKSVNEEHYTLGGQLGGLLEKNDLLIASTDLSHFLSESETRSIDRRTLDRIVLGDHKLLIREISSGACSMCGAAAVIAAMAYAVNCGANRRRELHYTTSAPVSGDTTRVVGYGAVSFEYPEVYP